ncbi:hypothetical protein ACEWY4_013552 [Coilia grayii]|uniref:BHLH domain-containing protein n=1 Tax=Coilia grayii TaxID=363190 RepID=A0ABD1JWS0_9TELE
MTDPSIRQQIRSPLRIQKPIVEKLRRDRINNSIVEIKALLSPQLLNQQPDSNAASQGFSRCAEEVNHSLFKDLKTQSHGKLLTQLQTLQPPSDDCRREMLRCQLSSPVLGLKLCAAALILPNESPDKLYVINKVHRAPTTLLVVDGNPFGDCIITLRMDGVSIANPDDIYIYII